MPDWKKLFWNPEGAAEKREKMDADLARRLAKIEAMRLPRHKRPDEPVAEFSGVFLEAAGTLLYDGDRRRTEGTSTVVEASGAIRTRLSATRLVATGVVGLFWRKKVDDRELYLLVDGPDFQWLVEVDARKGADARAFAARLNTLARV